MRSQKELIYIARTRANEKRNALGLGDEPISNIFNLLENQGIFLFIKPFKGNASAMFMRTKDIHIVIINSKHTLGHQIFSAAHELSHFFFDKELMGGVCLANKYNQDQEVERLADFFASYFLMPEEGLLKHISKRKKKANSCLDLSDIIYLQQYFRVSWQAMLYRLLNMGELSLEEVEKYKTVSIKSEAAKLGYDLDLYTPTYKECPSQKYIEYAMKAFKHDLISESKLNEYLSIIGTSLDTLDKPCDEER